MGAKQDDEVRGISSSFVAPKYDTIIKGELPRGGRQDKAHTPPPSPPRTAEEYRCLGRLARPTRVLARRNSFSRRRKKTRLPFFPPFFSPVVALQAVRIRTSRSRSRSPPSAKDCRGKDYYVLPSSRAICLGDLRLVQHGVDPRPTAARRRAGPATRPRSAPPP